MRRRLLALALLALLCVAARPVEPGIYRLFGWGYDGPGVVFAPWYQVNPEPDVFRWDVIDAELDRTGGPSQVFVTVHRSDIDAELGHWFVDDTPAWVYAGQDRDVISGRPVGHVLYGHGYDKAGLPAYDDRTQWQPAMAALIAALGVRYDGDPRVSSVIVSTGLDSETQPIKDANRGWTTLLREQAPDVEYRFGQFVYQAMDRYAVAFPTGQLYLNCAPGAADRLKRAEYAAARGIGLKHSGMWYDMDSHQGYGSYIGSWDHIRAYSETVSIWVESPFGLGNDEARLWSLYAGLHYHPDGMSVHPEYLSLDPRYLNWTRVHLGVDVGDTPSVWTALRDAEFPYQSWGSGGVSGHVGDWTFYLQRVSGGERVWRAELPDVPGKTDWQARQVRRGNMAFDVDPGFIRDSYVVIAEVLDTGAAVTLRYMGTDGQWHGTTAKGDGAMEWVEVSLAANDLDVSASPDIEIAGGESVYVHWVGVEGYGGTAPTATPSATVEPTMVPSVTATVATPTCTPSATPSATFTPAATPTLSLEQRASALKEWAREVLGIDLSISVEVGE